MWVARDRDNKLYLYPRKPIREKQSGIFSENEFCEVNSKYFPEVTWENSPKEIAIKQ